MSKKGGKGKGGKGKGNKGPTPQTAPPAQQAAPQEVAEVEEPHLPKFPPFDRLSHTPTGPAEAVEPIQKLLGFTLRVTLSDGRIIVGDLSSLDNHRNLILVNTYQAHITAEQTCTKANKTPLLFWSPPSSL